MRMIFHRFLFIIGVACCAMPAAAANPTLDFVQDLSFGKFAVLNNNSPHTIVINPLTNNATYDPAIVAIDPVQRGVYQLEVLPPNTAVTPSFTDTHLTPSGGGPQFSITNYTHNNPVSDGAGSATMYVGATLTTTGGGQHYNSDNYSGTFDIQIDY